MILDRNEMERHLGPEPAPGEGSAESLADRVAYVAELIVKNGDVPIVAVSNRLASTRARARLRVPRLIEVYVTTPARVCEIRNRSGGWVLSPEGGNAQATPELARFEVPTSPEVSVGTLDRTPHQSAEWVLRELDRLGIAGPATTVQPEATSEAHALETKSRQRDSSVA